MELMDTGKEWDLAIVDPPYGKKPTRNTDGLGVCIKNFESGSDEWDKKPSNRYWENIFKISNHQIIWGLNYFLDKLTPTNSLIVWDKNKSNEIFADCEVAWTSYNRVTKLFECTWNGMIQHDMKNKQRRIHPTEKPTRLYRWILNNYATKGDTILDTHGGSMSLAIACWEEGFDLDICELDEEYFNAAVQRFEQHIAQKQLF